MEQAPGIVLRYQKPELLVRALERLRGAAEGFAQLVLGAIECMAPARRQILSCSIDVERQHRHGGLKWRSLASAAAFSGALQRFCDVLGLPLVEHARLEIQRVVGIGDIRRPSLAAASATRLSPFRLAFGPLLCGRRHRRFTIGTEFIFRRASWKTDLQALGSSVGGLPWNSKAPCDV